MHLRLWPDEVEALRMDIRDTVARQMAAINAVYSIEDAPPDGRDERVRAQRVAVAATYRSSPHVVERRINGVRCLVAEPPGGGRASAIYLHFHGGGMIIGAPEAPVSDERRVVYSGFGLAPRSGDEVEVADGEHVRRARAALAGQAANIARAGASPGSEAFRLDE